MKFTCNTFLISQACQNVQRAVSAKSSLPATEGILISARENFVELTGYDLEIGIKTSIPASIEKTGAIILNARILCEILRKIPNDNVKFECDDRNLCVIKSGEIKYELIGIAADEFPELPSVNNSLKIEIEKEVLADMVRKTAFAVSANDAKIVYTGIKFEITQGEIKLIAVDGFRMAIKKAQTDYNGDDVTFIVPAKSLQEVIKLSNEDNDKKVTLGIAKMHILFETNGYNIVSRLLEGEFINYKSAIPQTSSTEVRVSVRDFTDSIERTSLIITDRTKSLISCIFDENTIKISSVTSIGTANDKINAEIKGSRVEIGFNNRFLTEALKASDEEVVNIKLNGPLSPILITPCEGDDFIFLVLPVRLKK